MNLFNSQGDSWTADYLKTAGELDVDLRSNIAAEARAWIVYERLINCCDDPGSLDALQFLMTCETTHMKAFMPALESMGEDPPPALVSVGSYAILRHLSSTLPTLRRAGADRPPAPREPELFDFCSLSPTATTYGWLRGLPPDCADFQFRWGFERKGQTEN